MKITFEIVNVKKTKFKSSVFDVSATIKNTSTSFDISAKLNCFDKKTDFSLHRFLNKTIASADFTVVATPIIPEIQKAVSYKSYGFKKEMLFEGKRYSSFVMQNLDEILEKIKILYFNFNQKYNCNIEPSQFAVVRILDSLTLVKCTSIDVFNNIDLDDLYPEIFELECKGVIKKWAEKL